MLKLFCFEVKKNYLKRYILIAIVLLFILNLLVIYNKYISGIDPSGYFITHSENTKKKLGAYDSLHKKLDGDLTNSKAQYIIEENERVESVVSDGTYSKEYQANTYTGYYWGDYVMINKYFYKPMKYLSTYSIVNKNVVDKAKSNIIFYDLYRNYYEKAKNDFIVKNYENRNITLFYDTKSWEVLFDYNFSDLLILFLILLGIVPIFANEIDTKMHILILSSKNGKANMTYIKVLSTLVYIVFLVVVFSLSNYLLFKMTYGLNGGDIPVYAIEKYQNTPIDFSVGEFYFVIQILKILGLFSFSMVILTLSSLFNRIIYSYMVSVILMFGGIYASGYVSSVELVKTLFSIFSPFTLVSGEKLFIQLLGINIANKFYLRANICLLVQSLIITILFLILYFLYSERNIFNIVRRKHSIIEDLFRINPFKKGGIE